MAKSEEEIRAEIKGHIDRKGGPYSSWYVGIAEDARDRLFDGHGVDDKNDLWIFDTASSADAARRIEDYFVNELGTDGGTGGGGKDTDKVYAYKKKSHTSP